MANLLQFYYLVKRIFSEIFRKLVLSVEVSEARKSLAKKLGLLLVPCVFSSCPVEETGLSCEGLGDDVRTQIGLMPHPEGWGIALEWDDFHTRTGNALEQVRLCCIPITPTLRTIPVNYCQQGLALCHSCGAPLPGATVLPSLAQRRVPFSGP